MVNGTPRDRMCSPSRSITQGGPCSTAPTPGEVSDHIRRAPHTLVAAWSEADLSRGPTLHARAWLLAPRGEACDTQGEGGTRRGYTTLASSYSLSWEGILTMRRDEMPSWVCGEEVEDALLTVGEGEDFVVDGVTTRLILEERGCGDDEPPAHLLAPPSHARARSRDPLSSSLALFDHAFARSHERALRARSWWDAVWLYVLISVSALSRGVVSGLGARLLVTTGRLLGGEGRFVDAVDDAEYDAFIEECVAYAVEVRGALSREGS